MKDLKKFTNDELKLAYSAITGTINRLLSLGEDAKEERAIAANISRELNLRGLR